jgi:hypothetical protein
MALTTMSSWSFRSSLQTAKVRTGSPLPPLALLFKCTVLTRADLRHQRLLDAAHSWTSSADICFSRQHGPERKHAKVSTESQLSRSAPSLSSDLLIEASQGIHPKVVQGRLGHSNFGITIDTYSHVSPSMGTATAVSFADGLNSAKPQPELVQ